MLADFVDIEAVFADALFDDFIIEDWKVVFSGEAFRTADETCATMQKISDIAALRVGRVLVGENHVSGWNVIFLVISHHLADVVVEDDLITVTRSGSVD